MNVLENLPSSLTAPKVSATAWDGVSFKFKPGDRVTFRNEAGIDWPGNVIAERCNPANLPRVFRDQLRYTFEPKHGSAHWFPHEESSLTLEVRP